MESTMPELNKTKDLQYSAQLTLANMQEYYDMYNVDWGLTEILNAIDGLDNYDIVAAGQIIGAVRLSYDDGCCQLRDIQLIGNYKNLGLGASIVDQLVKLSRDRGCISIELKVFKRSPAYRLYQRKNFIVTKQDDRFYYMSLNLK